MTKHFAEGIERTRKHDKPDYPRLGYYWIPAAVDGTISTVKIGHKEVKDPEFLGLQKKVIDGRSYVLIGTPTRKLVVTSGTLGPFKGKLDGVANVGDAFLKSTSFSLYGVADAPKTKLSAKRDHIRSLSYVVQDSGGFQLSTGVEEFIDPKRVAQCHSIYADSGVALDIPSSSLRDKDIVLASARMLVANNAILREYTDPVVKLLNVCHGYNLETRLAYLKIIQAGEKLDSLCVGGLRQPAAGAMRHLSMERSSPVGFISHVLLSMLFTEKTYYHYHVLGVSSDWQMALLSLASHVHQKLVTSDSATHALTGKSGTLMQYGNHRLSGHKTGRDMTDYINARCSCPVCHTMQYEFPYRDGAGSLAELHNGFILSAKAKLYDALVKTKTSKLKPSALAELLLANTSFRHSATPHMLREFFQAVDMVVNTKSYKDLSKYQFKAGSSNTLFAVKKPTDSAIANFVAVLARYEAYHGKSFRK